VAQLLLKARKWQALLASGEVTSQAEIARREGLSRARVTQIMNLLRLAPEIQSHILQLPASIRRPISERTLRSIGQIGDHHSQVQAFEARL
jgi:ParB-like chromosome segregation protein Spo0J